MFNNYPLLRYILRLASDKPRVIFEIVSLSFIQSLLEALSLTAVFAVVSMILSSSENLLGTLGFRLDVDTAILILITSFVAASTFKLIVNYRIQTQTAKFSSEILIGVINQIKERDVKSDQFTETQMSNLFFLIGPAVGSILLNMMQLISNLILSIAISVSVFYLMSSKVFVVILLIILAYICYSLVISKALREISEKISASNEEMVAGVNSVLRGVRDYLSLGTLDKKTQKMCLSIEENNRKKAIAAFLNPTPRIVVETFAVSSLGVFMLWRTEDLNTLLPTVAVMGVAAQRVLPSIQAIFVVWADTRSRAVDVEKWISFQNKMCSGRTSFSYDHIRLNLRMLCSPKAKSQNLNKCTLAFPRYALKDSIDIPSGMGVLITGVSGIGKSSFFNHVGSSSNPEIMVTVFADGRTERLRFVDFVHVIPQAVFCFDDTVKNNISLGLDVCEKKLNSMFASETSEPLLSGMAPGQAVGMEGAFISGGQRQRIGIARALLSDKRAVLIDESFSGLDSLAYRSCLNYLFENFEYVFIISHIPIDDARIYCEIEVTNLCQ